MTSMASSLAYSTDSAGMHTLHTLPLKLRAIAGAGFKQIEMGFPDLEVYAEQENLAYEKLDNAGRGDLGALCAAAHKIRALCSELDLSVLVMHPFEGYRDTRRREEGFERAAAWFEVLKALDCQMLQVGSTDDPDTSADYDLIARDLRQLSDEAAAQDPPIRIAYEMWAWGSHVNTWEHAWEVCERIDRPNFGLCLDTFQICARAYGDPTSPTGLIKDPQTGADSAQHTLAESLKSLARTLPPAKIFYLQISDGSRIVAPDALVRSAHGQHIPPLYAWSNAWRPVPFMDEAVRGLERGESHFGGYLPVVDVCEAVLKTGWRGPWSFEVFYEKDMARGDPDVPAKWARTAMRSYALLEERLRAKRY